jgi:putative addiction module component (TIGR02574 family)
MSMTTDYSYLFDLPTADKLQLVQDLWDDIAASEEPLPIPEWQIDELRRRKTLRTANAMDGSTWQEVQKRILGRRLND